MLRPYAALAALLVLLDLATKSWIFARLGPHEPWILLPDWLRLIEAENHGGLFGIFSRQAWANLFFTVASLAALGILGVIALRNRDRHRVLLAVALILGGAFGNLYDRLVFSHVRDFIDLLWFGKPFWPTFNLADTWICIGTALITWHFYHEPAESNG